METTMDLVPKNKVLIIDDEKEVREAIRSVLTRHFDVLTASDGTSGIRSAREENPDLILLDLLMPGVDGIQVCRTLKSEPATKSIPIIMITATNDDDRRAEALLAGADELTSKPFRPREFLVRINSIINGSHGSAIQNEPVLECGNVRLDPNKLEVTVNGTRTDMTVLEIKLLALLIRNRGNILKRQQILDAVWQEKEVLDRVVDNHILSLRRKLAGFDHDLVSVYGAGYGIKPLKK
jgi:two-component system alkaline phosphatase synthesis response regulator PhoP